MDVKSAKRIFVWGTIFFSAVFIVLTVQSMTTLPKRTHSDKITASVAHGKNIWMDHNCNDCHTILGIGGYYAPDVTKIYKEKGRDYLTAFIKSPEKTTQMSRVMPNLGLTEEETKAVVDFLEWVSNINTNDWPPKPLLASAVSSQASPGGKDKVAKGRGLFQSLNCAGCHTINGVGGMVGPDLTNAGSKFKPERIMAQLNNPKQFNPASLMPSFQNLPEDQKNALVQYLESLK